MYSEPSLELLAEINAYLTEKMKPEEKEKFEQRVAQEAPLKRLVEEHKLTHQLLLSAREQQIRAWGNAALEELNAEEDDPQPGRRSVVDLIQKSMVLPLLLAAVVLVIVLIYFSSTSSSSLTPTQLADNQFQGTELGTSSLAANDERRVAIKQSIQKGDYAGAIPLIQVALTQDSLTASQRADLLLYLGFCQYHQGELSAALQSFHAIPDSEESYPESQWRISLIYLKQGDLSHAQQILQRISQDTYHPYTQEAAALIRQLAKDSTGTVDKSGE